MALRGFPDGWHARQGVRAGVTVIHGWDSRQGLVVTAAAGGLLVPLMLAVSGLWGALTVLLLCLLVGTGLGYRLEVAPEGLLYQRTWYGLRWSRRRLPLRTSVAKWSTFEEPEGDGLVLEGEPPIHLPASQSTAGALKQALQEAILRATRVPPSGEGSGAG